MNILISNNVVIHMTDEPIFEADGQWATDSLGKLCLNVNDVTLVQGATEPPHKFVYAYSYDNGAWTIADQDQYDMQYANLSNTKAAEIRKERNTKLAETDWTQAGDLPVEFRAAWATYRQALRNMPNAETFPWNDFPAVPNVPTPSSAPNEGVTQA